MAEVCDGDEPVILPVIQPNHPVPETPWQQGKLKCSKCGLVLEGVMMYVCPHLDCPTFMQVTCRASTTVSTDLLESATSHMARAKLTVS